MLFHRKTPVSWLIVGLGNPGGQYDNTRHNAGFAVADELARRGGFDLRRVKFKALTASAVVGGQGNNRPRAIAPERYESCYRSETKFRVRSFWYAGQDLFLVKKKEHTQLQSLDTERSS